MTVQRARDPRFLGPGRDPVRRAGYLDLVDAVLEADVVRIGAPTLVEPGMVLAGRRGSPVGRELDGLVREFGITVVPFGEPTSGNRRWKPRPTATGVAVTPRD